MSVLRAVREIVSKKANARIFEIYVYLKSGENDKDTNQYPALLIGNGVKRHTYIYIYKYKYCNTYGSITKSTQLYVSFSFHMTTN